MKIARRISLAGLVLLFVSLSAADVRLAAVLGSNMVMQRETKANIWGWADPGEKITVGTSWQSFPIKPATADKDGKWKIAVNTPAAGGPYKITIKGKNTITLENILIGEVWLASGQSNMEMPLVKVSNSYTGIKDSEKEVAAANYPEIRLFQVGNFSSKEPLDDVGPGIEMYGVPASDCKWKACSSETIAAFSSTAYFFARKLHKELGVPVGIIDSTWGGTRAEVWTPAAGLEKLGYTNELKQAAESPQDAKKKLPTRLYNGMIHPLRNLTIRGAIWYQGEGNSWQANKYRDLFSTMITSWRTAWGQGDFPFYFVQIAPFKYSENNPSEELREAQMKTLSLKNTGMAVTMDIANLTDIHPKNKQEVGRRLALWALAKDYGKKTIVYSGPIYKSMRVEGDKIRLTFDYTGSGLKTIDGKEISHLTIAGADKKFVEAKGVIDGDTVVVYSDAVKNPAAVRYGWSNTAEPNLANKEGLPASSFRTDD
ncbi:MAG: sialate O-acetylesterase [Phycisphaerae bacterium]|nr:sialate O-acetylesterase [Phycisphaerae bacterium]